MHTRFEQIVRGIASSMNCEVEITIKQVTAPVINNEAVTERVLNIAQALLPQNEIESNPYLTMGAEDMGYMQEKADGCYCRRGLIEVVFAGQVAPAQRKLKKK